MLCIIFPECQQEMQVLKCATAQQICKIPSFAVTAVVLTLVDLMLLLT